MLPGVKRRNPLVVGNLVFTGEAFVQDLKKSPSQMTGAWESGRIAGRTILTQSLTLDWALEGGASRGNGEKLGLSGQLPQLRLLTG
jgi:hypothetical protein